MAYQTYQFQWRGFVLGARYDPHWVAEGDIAHLEIRSVAPECAALPVTETGYLSHFHTRGIIEEDYAGDVVAAVTDWLDAAAQSKEWKSREAALRQGDFFDALGVL